MSGFFAYSDDTTLTPPLKTLIQHTTTVELLNTAKALKRSAFHWLPLHLLRAALRRGEQPTLFTQAFHEIIRTPRELADFYVLYGDEPLAAVFKRCAERAFRRFTASQVIHAPPVLRTLMRRAHPKPTHQLQSHVWRSFLAGDSV